MTDTKDQTPAPPPTTHPDGRELGFGAVDARPDGDASGEVAGALNSGGESNGAAKPASTPPENRDGDHDGQSQQGYSGGDNLNSTSTRDASHDRAA